MLGRCAVAIVLGFLVAAPASSAAVFPVGATDDGEDAVPGDGVCSTLVNPRCTLRAAIEESNALAGPDQVNLPPGTYSLGPLGELDVSSNIVVEGLGTAANTHIQPATVGRIFNVASGASLELRDATVRNGVVAAEGGGIRTQGRLVLRRVLMTNNEANNDDGGAIAIVAPASGNTTILNSTIGSPGGPSPDNRAGGTGVTVANGAGIDHEDGTLTIRDSTIADNRVQAGDGTAVASATGGGIHSDDALVIEDTSIRSNVVTANSTLDAGGAFGGALQHNSGALTVRRTTVAGNQATASGTTASGGGLGSGAPGLIVDSTFSANSSETTSGNGISHTGSPGDTLTVRRSAVTGNQAGGILAAEPLNLENSTVSGNGGGTGVLATFGITIAVRSSTITAHTGGLGRGLSAVGAGSAVTVAGSIVAANAANCEELAGGTIVSNGANIDSTDGCGFAAAGDQPNTNPLLGPLQSNGGPTQTRAIPSSSPARDAVTGGCPPPPTDQRGVARPQGPRCDSGAFEIAVSPPPPPPPPTPPSGELELSLSGKGKQKAKRLTVDVSCGTEACSVELGGKGKVPTRSAVTAKAKKLKLKPKAVDVAVGETETVRLKFRKNRKTVKKVRALLKRGGKKARKRAKVTVDATATGAGGTDTATRKIKLKR